ncbi:MAG: hypothetical protein ACYTAF_02565 [Planctomycetota bacterium]
MTEKKDFGSLAIELNLLTQRQLDRIIDIQKSLERQGVKKRLGEICVAEGLLTAEQFKEILGRLGKVILFCTKCSKQFNVFGYLPNQVIFCKSCGEELKKMDDVRDPAVEGTAERPSVASGSPAVPPPVKEAAQEVIRREPLEVERPPTTRRRVRPPTTKTRPRVRPVRPTAAPAAQQPIGTGLIVLGGAAFGALVAVILYFAVLRGGPAESPAPPTPAGTAASDTRIRQLEGELEDLRRITLSLPTESSALLHILDRWSRLEQQAMPEGLKADVAAEKTRAVSAIDGRVLQTIESLERQDQLLHATEFAQPFVIKSLPRVIQKSREIDRLIRARLDKDLQALDAAISVADADTAEKLIDRIGRYACLEREDGSEHWYSVTLARKIAKANNVLHDLRTGEQE